MTQEEIRLKTQTTCDDGWDGVSCQDHTEALEIAHTTNTGGVETQTASYEVMLARIKAGCWKLITRLSPVLLSLSL